jgi:hypothetical protein
VTTTRSTRPTRLRIGEISASARRRDLQVVLLLAAIWRLVPLLRLWRGTAGVADAVGRSEPMALFAAVPDLLSTLRSPDVSWAGSPLYLLVLSTAQSLGVGLRPLLAVQTLVSLLLVLAVYRVGYRWLGHPAALGAALLVAVSGPMVAVGLVLLPAAALAWGSLVYASALMRFAAARRASGAYSLGLACGGLGWLAAVGGLWLPATLLWLPTTSRRYRGRPGARVAGLIALGWLTAQSPILVRGLAVQRDLVLPFTNASYDVYCGVTHPDLLQEHDAVFPLDPIARRRVSIERLARLAAKSSTAEVPRTWTYARLAVRVWGTQPGDPLERMARRAVSFLGTDASGPALRFHVPGALFDKLALMPLTWVTPVALLGMVALAGSLRRYLPLYLGFLLPALVAALTGLTARGQAVATPFLGLMASYGLVRWWDGRGAWLTWVLAPLLTAAGIVLVQRF